MQRARMLNQKTNKGNKVQGTRGRLDLPKSPGRIMFEGCCPVKLQVVAQSGARGRFGGIVDAKSPLRSSSLGRGNLSVTACLQQLSSSWGL